MGYWVRSYDLYREIGDSAEEERALEEALALADQFLQLDESELDRDRLGDALISEMNGNLQPAWRNHAIYGATEEPAEVLTDAEVAKRMQRVYEGIRERRKRPNQAVDTTPTAAP
jgi:ribulose-5-phosphate 4-epimerase/fuculose-1-phosphate aldolase